MLELYLGFATAILRHLKDLLFPYTECLGNSSLLCLSDMSGREATLEGRFGHRPGAHVSPAPESISTKPPEFHMRNFFTFRCTMTAAHMKKTAKMARRRTTIPQRRPITRGFPNYPLPVSALLSDGLKYRYSTGIRTYDFVVHSARICGEVGRGRRAPDQAARHHRFEVGKATELRGHYVRGICRISIRPSLEWFE